MHKMTITYTHKYVSILPLTHTPKKIKKKKNDTVSNPEKSFTVKYRKHS